jgi:VWFA-related protein
MRSKAVPKLSLLIPLLVCVSLPTPPVRAQDTNTTPPARQQGEAEEVVRISTELVQTDVMVFDKEGKFVDGLKPEQFELKVDGRPQTISFFERIQAGAIDEDAQLAAARGGANRPSSLPGAVQPLDRGRTIFFFIDDLHLSPSSALRTRKTLLRFINEEIKQNDEAAITSATGQIGFLQQLTGDKVVLRAAVERITPRLTSARDFENPPMSEVQAQAIELNDSQVTDFFVGEALRENPRMGREAALNIVQARARNLMRQSSHITVGTLATLENIVRTSAPLPGRKIVFFISEGFLLDTRDSDIRDRLRRITDAAARAGVVIYSMDARGLVTGMPEAGDRVAFDVSGQLSRVNASEVSSMQEPLRTLAADTGGRALLNTNALNLAFTRALKETSVYYLLAWRPDPEGARGGDAKFRRIEVSLKDRAGLNVIVRRGFYTTPLPSGPARDKSKEKKNAPVPPVANRVDTELLDAIKSLYPRVALPTSLSLGYVSAPNLGMVLTASVELDGKALTFNAGQDQKSAVADVAGALYDDRGKVVSTSRQELVISSTFLEQVREQRRRIIYSFQYRVAPGLYQVRVASRDKDSGRTGSAMRWVEVPDPKRPGLMLSSLFVGERTPTAPSQKEATPDPLLEGVMLSADRRFARTSWIRFVTYIYNAAAGTAAQPDVALQVQVFRDDQPVVTTPLRKIDTTGLQDTTRIPYAAEIALASFPVGRYVLQVTAIDRTAKSSASQRVDFMVE